MTEETDMFSIFRLVKSRGKAPPSRDLEEALADVDRLIAATEERIRRDEQAHADFYLEHLDKSDAVTAKRGSELVAAATRSRAELATLQATRAQLASRLGEARAAKDRTRLAEQCQAKAKQAEEVVAVIRELDANAQIKGALLLKYNASYRKFLAMAPELPPSFQPLPVEAVLGYLQATESAHSEGVVKNPRALESLDTLRRDPGAPALVKAHLDWAQWHDEPDAPEAA